MPANAPGRNDPPGQKSGGPRTVRVYNVDPNTVPPFGAMEIQGWDSDRAAFRVVQCTLSGRNDLIFNGMTPIPSGMEGQAFSEVQTTAGFVPSEGSNPVTGEIWGVPAGEWFLKRHVPGYTIVDTTTAVRGWCVVKSQRFNLTEFVRVTGTKSADAPVGFVGAELVAFNPKANAWETASPSKQVWFRDMYGTVGYYDAAGGPCYAHVNLSGWANGRPVYVGRGDCSTTTTTTTTGPTTTTTTQSACSGRCKWDYNFTTKTWTRTSSTCPGGCNCFAPTFCPTGSSGSVCTYTNCGYFGTDQTPPNCTGTTTTKGASCTTTAGPGCTAGCQWYCHPVNGWTIKSNGYGCSSSCPCNRPTGSCGPCDETTTPCVLPPPPSCGGSCRWVWVAPSVGSPYWSYVTGNCVGSNVPNCYCDPPSSSGSTCGQEANTACYVHGTSTGSDPCGDPPTTTTAGPGCSGTCLWATSDGSTWDTIVRSCLGCDCPRPVSAPTDTCAQVEVPCQTVTTTTTTTTAGPTTTTTTAGPTTTTASACTTCTWKCITGTWTQTVSCVGTNCNCPASPGSPPPPPPPPPPSAYCWQCYCGINGFPPCSGYPNGIYYNCGASGGPGSGCTAVGGPFSCGAACAGGLGNACGSLTAPECDPGPPPIPCDGAHEGVAYQFNCFGTTTTGGATTTASATTSPAPTTTGGVATTAGPTTTGGVSPPPPPPPTTGGATTTASAGSYYCYYCADFVSGSPPGTYCFQDGFQTFDCGSPISGPYPNSACGFNCGPRDFVIGGM